jgi:hypothetical protein
VIPTLHEICSFAVAQSSRILFIIFYYIFQKERILKKEISGANLINYLKAIK